MEASFASGYTARPESPKQEASLHVDNFTAEIFFYTPRNETYS